MVSKFVIYKKNDNARGRWTQSILLNTISQISHDSSFITFPQQIKPTQYSLSPKPLKVIEPSQLGSTIDSSDRRLHLLPTQSSSPLQQGLPKTGISSNVDRY
ncbi:hypothetical protein L1887_06415 [Cichorium endivia]|nr:hypothetical protein L1887_06415 [Cichorium endivia]